MRGGRYLRAKSCRRSDIRERQSHIIYCAKLAWPRSKALLFLSDGIGAYASAFQTNRLCCMSGTSFDSETFMGLIKKEKPLPMRRRYSDVAPT